MSHNQVRVLGICSVFITCGDALHGRLQDGHLTSLQIRQVFEFEPPFDLRIPCERTGARTGYISQYAVEQRIDWEPPGIGGDHLNVARGNKFAQHARAMRMQFRCNDVGIGIELGKGSRLPARCGAAVEDAKASADEKRNQL